MSAAPGGIGGLTAPGVDLLARPAIAGAGPDVDQANRSAASAWSSMMTDPVPMGRGPGDPVDVASPQQFVRRPTTAELVADTAVGDETATESLPGRIWPAIFDDDGPPSLMGL